MAPLVVDPVALDGAGSAVVGIGDGLAAAVATLTSGFSANTGQDFAGEMFGLAYQDAAESVMKASAAGVDAFRRVGCLVRASAANYSKAEAASMLGGGAGALPTPAEPEKFAAPGAPWTLGPGVAEPPLWTVVEAFVGDLWPNGNPGQLRAAATCWRTFGAALQGAKDTLHGPDAVVGAQHIPEDAKIRTAFCTLGEETAKVGAQCDKLATRLDDFADEVTHAQNAIRDLLHRLGSASGLWHEAVAIFKGHGLDELKRIVNDIKAVLHNLKREADAKRQAVQHAIGLLDGAALGLEIFVRMKLTQFLGEEVGNPLATAFDVYVNTGVGFVEEFVDLEQQAEGLDPMRFAYDPQGAMTTWGGTVKGLGEMALLANPSTFFAVEALDPQAAPNLARQLVHADDWTRDRPGFGFGKDLADVSLFFLPAGEIGAGARAAEGAGAAELGEAGGASAAGRGARVAGEAAEVLGRRGALGEIGTTTRDLTANLDTIATDAPKADPAPGGRPLSPAGPGRAPDGPAAAPVEPKPAGPGSVPRDPAAPAPHGATEPMPGERAPIPEPAAPRVPPGDGLPPAGAAPQPSGLASHAAQSAPSHASPHPGGHPAEPPPSHGYSHGSSGGGSGGGGGGHNGGGGRPVVGDGSGTGGFGRDHGDGDAHDHEHGEGDGHGNGASSSDHKPTDGSGRDSHQAEDGSPSDHDDTSPGLTDEKRDEILAMEKGTRPDPSEYLTQEYIHHHLEKFNGGGTRFMLNDTFEDFGIGQRDGTTFVFPTSKIDELMESTRGDPTALEKALGLPGGYFKDNVIRVDIKDPQHYNLRVPSGNEAGANKLWLPGGFLPRGMPEAVIDGAEVPPEDVVREDFPQQGRK